MPIKKFDISRVIFNFANLGANTVSGCLIYLIFMVSRNIMDNYHVDFFMIGKARLLTFQNANLK